MFFSKKSCGTLFLKISCKANYSSAFVSGEDLFENHFFESDYCRLKNKLKAFLRSSFQNIFYGHS